MLYCMGIGIEACICKFHYAYLYDTVEDQGFSEEELALFKTRFEEGYDITDDERYNKWLRQEGISVQ